MAIIRSRVVRPKFNKWPITTFSKKIVHLSFNFNTLLYIKNQAEDLFHDQC